ncbi:hypothetical protein U0070_012852, partial [Myodes glareolus]
MHKTFLMMASVIEFMIRIIGNELIMLMNRTDWARSWKISLVDFVLSCMCLSRICFCKQKFCTSLL